MMNTILDLINRTSKPTPWSEGDNIPWDDPAFSERMLAEHLSQNHDLASRRSQTIVSHVEWIYAHVLNSRPASVLDLACGPGFYTTGLAKLGCQCVGRDFSPASIQYAKQEASTQKLPCQYHHADIRDGRFGNEFDLVMLIYGQFNVFPRSIGLEILKNAYQALKHGGSLLLEVQSFKQIQRNGEDAPSWYSTQTGLFSSEPHLVLQENHWDEEANAATTRFVVVDGRSAKVSSYALSNEAYTEQEFMDVLHLAGFKEVALYPSLCGKTVSDDYDLPVMVGRK